MPVWKAHKGEPKSKLLMSLAASCTCIPRQQLCHAHSLDSFSCYFQQRSWLPALRFQNVSALVKEARRKCRTSCPLPQHSALGHKDAGKGLAKGTLRHVSTLVAQSLASPAAAAAAAAEQPCVLKRSPLGASHTNQLRLPSWPGVSALHRPSHAAVQHTSRRQPASMRISACLWSQLLSTLPLRRSSP